MEYSLHRPLPLAPLATDASPSEAGRGLEPPLDRLPARSLWHKHQDRISSLFFLLAACTAILAVCFIFIFVGKESLPLFTTPEGRQEASLSKLFMPQVYKLGQAAKLVWQPISKIPKFSVIPLLVGTAKVTVVAMLFATPLAVLSALFSVELAPRGLRELLKPAVEMLAGIPSVVIGFFALMVLAPQVQAWLGLETQLNGLVAGLAVGIAILPILFTICEDAFSAVPTSYREASLALGADRFQTALKVVFPAALPGVLAAVILGAGRAMGETMIVLMASGNAAILSPNLADPVRTLSATVAAEMLEVVQGDVHASVLFFIGTLLFCLTGAMNLAASRLARRVQRRLSGGTP